MYTREDTQPKMADNVPLPPEVWARIATHTRSERGISHVSQVCRASYQGVTESPRPWRMLEKKYGVQRCEDATRVREAFLRFAEDRKMVKDRFMTFADPDKDGSPPLDLVCVCLGVVIMSDVFSDRDMYNASLAALQRDGSDKAFFRQVEVPCWSVMLAGNDTLSPRVVMGCLCAAYAAVCTSMAILLVVRDESSEINFGDTPPRVLDCLGRFLEKFPDKDGALVPDWLVGYTMRSGNDEGDNGIRLDMRNSSTIFVCSMADPLPLLGPYDGIVVCAKHDATFEWMDKTSDSGELEPWLPKHRVHFG